MSKMKNVLMIMVFAFSMIFVMGNQAEAKKKTLEFDSPIVEENRVTLKWNNVNANYYVVSRAKVGKNVTGYGAKYEKIATIKGNKTKYVDKKVSKGKKYIYTVTAYKKNGKKIKKSKYGCFVTTKILKPSFTDSEACDFNNTPEAITLRVNADDEFFGVTPSGYDIYRCDLGSNTWTKIKSMKKKTSYMEYTDKNVTAGKVYEYYVNAYWKKNGKKINKKTSIEKRYAVNDSSRAKFGIEVLNADNTVTDTIELKITNQKGNGDVNFNLDNDNVRFFIEYATKTYQKDAENVFANIDEYIIDGKNWEKLGDKKVIEVKPEGALYIRLKVKNAETKKDVNIHFSKKDMRTLKCTFDVKSYCGYGFDFEMDLLKESAKLEYDEN